MDESFCKVCPPVFTFSNVLISDATEGKSVAFYCRAECQQRKMPYNARHRLGRTSQACRSSRITVRISVVNVARQSCAFVGAFGLVEDSATNVSRVLLERTGCNAAL